MFAHSTNPVHAAPPATHDHPAFSAVLDQTQASKVKPSVEGRAQTPRDPPPRERSQAVSLIANPSFFNAALTSSQPAAQAATIRGGMTAEQANTPVIATGATADVSAYDPAPAPRALNAAPAPSSMGASLIGERTFHETHAGSGARIVAATLAGSAPTGEATKPLVPTALSPSAPGVARTEAPMGASSTQPEATAPLPSAPSVVRTDAPMNDPSTQPEAMAPSATPLASNGGNAPSSATAPTTGGRNAPLSPGGPLTPREATASVGPIAPRSPSEWAFPWQSDNSSAFWRTPLPPANAPLPESNASRGDPARVGSPAEPPSPGRPLGERLVGSSTRVRTAAPATDKLAAKPSRSPAGAAQPLNSSGFAGFESLGHPDPQASPSLAVGGSPPLQIPFADPSTSPIEIAQTSTAQRVPAASAPMPSPVAAVREIDVDLSPGGLEDVSMTMRLAGDKLSIVIRAASSQTTGAMEGARDAIAERLAAIGQPIGSLLIQQTGSTSDGANANGPSGGEGGGHRPQGGRGDPNDPRGARRGSSGF
jgi:hypothetical protein